MYYVLFLCRFWWMAVMTVMCEWLWSVCWKSIFMHQASAVSWVHVRFASYVYGEVWFYHVLFVLTYLACILSSAVHSFSVFCLWRIKVFIKISINSISLLRLLCVLVLVILTVLVVQSNILYNCTQQLQTHTHRYGSEKGQPMHCDETSQSVKSRFSKSECF